jgi:putative transposase
LCKRLKSNRLVDPDHTFNPPISGLDIPPEGRVVHLLQYGFIKVFGVVYSDGYDERWVTDIRDHQNLTGNHSKNLAGI